MALGVSVVSATENSASDTLDDFLKKSERISSNTQTSVSPFAITQEPTFTINSSDYTDYKNPNVNDTSTPAPALTWKEGNNGLIYLSSPDNTIVENIEINLNQDGKAQLWSGKTLAIRPGFAKDTTVAFNSNGHGIQMGENGDGEFKLQFRLTGSNSPETYINATFSNTTGDDALKGNLKINGGYDNYASTPAKPNATINFSGNLNGNLIQENTLNWDYTPFSEINFTKGSITGNVDIQIGGITLKFAEGGVKGNVDIFAESTTTTTVKFIRTTGNDLSIGKVGGFIEGKLSATGEGDGRTNFTVGYADTVKTGDKVISLNPEDKNKFDITRGSFSFYNMKAIKFVDDSGAKKTLTLKDGAVENSTFEFDRSVISAGATPTIITGNLVALDGKSIRLSLIDDSSIDAPLDQSQLKTLRVDGSIVATGSGLSLFYNDRLNCFEAKVEATGGVIQQGGFIGRNDAWFTSTQNATTIQATSGGTSHLIFDKASTISGVDNGNGKLAIRARNGNATDLKFNGGVNITGNIEASSGTNTITASSFNGSGIGVIATGSGINSITATSGNATFAGITASVFVSGGRNLGNTVNLGSGSITINAMEDGNAVYVWNGEHKNEITASTITVNGSVEAGGGAISNSFFSNNSITVNGNIVGSSANNFALTADNASLTLKGENSAITTLTALDSATNGNTLTLDASNNNSVVATINTLTNGGKLNVNFAGINADKITQLTLNAGTNSNLKSVSVANGTNNTLFLTGTNSNTMTIGSASIGGATGNKKGVIFDLSSGVNLTFTNGLTTEAQGVTTFNLGATNTITGDLTNKGIHNFNLNSSSKTTTFKHGSGLAFSNGENNINFNVDGMGLNWQGTDGSSHDITTSGGITNLNFINSGALNNGVGITTNTSGTTNINIYNGKTATISGAITTSTGAQTNVLFKGSEGVTTRGVPTYSILNISGASNKITSVTSESNAKIAIGANEGAEIDNITIGNGASLVFAFTGDNASTVTATNGITVGNGATLGISLSGDGKKKVVAGGSAKITLGIGSTLLIDFQAGNSATGIIGDGTPFTIEENRNSIVNFWGTNTGSLNADGNNSVTIDGGNNTVNFYGSATFGGIAFGTKGGTNTINVVDDDTGIIGTVAVADISKSAVTNIINLGKNATLTLTSANTTLTSSSTGNELNFIGDNATFQGGFGVSGSGKATINVGMISANPTDTIPPVSGKITGAVTGAGLKFNAGESTLTLQGVRNTFTSLTSGASDGILYLDASTSNVSAEIGSSFAIGSGKSLTFALVSGGNTAGATTTGGEASVSVNGAITVGTGGTLGIAIGGNNENGQRSVTASKGITFQGGSTLRVDFLANSAGTASLGTGKDGFIITDGNKSVINFYAGSSATLDGGLTIDGGDNTVNFQGSAQLRDIKLISGTNTINVLGASVEASKITATLVSDSLGGNEVSNTVNLEKFAVLNLKADKSSGDGSGSIKTLVNVNDESTVIQGNLLDGSSIAFTKKTGGLTLKGATSSGATNTLTTISTVDGASNTLTLDTSNGNNTTTVSGNVNASGLSVNLNTASSTHIATLNLNGGSLKSINVANGDADHNILSLNSGVTSIENAIALSTASTGLSIQFNGGELNAIGGITSATDKLINLSTISNKNSIVSGGVITTNSLTINSNSSLAVRNATATFATVSGSGTLTLDGANAGANVEVTATRVDGNNITANFNGNATGGNTLVLSDTTTLADITFGANSANNTISVASGKTLTVAKAEGVAIGSGNAITFSLAKDSTLTLTNGMTSAGNSTISVASSGSANSATLSGGNINVSNVSLSGNNASTLTLTATSTDIATLTTSATTSNTLIVDGAGSTNGASATLHTINGALDIEMNGANSKVATLTLNGGSINSVSATAGNEAQNIINFKSGTTIITNAIDSSKVASGQGLALNINSGRLILEDVISTDGGGTINVNNNATLQLKGGANKINSLEGNGVVDLAVADFNGNTVTRSVRARAFKTLTITDYSGNNTFNIYVDPKNPDTNGYKADQVIVTSGSGSATFTVTGNIDDILGITYNSQKPNDPNNVQVASGMTNIEVSGGDSLIGYDIIQAQVFKDGGNVYLGQAISKGVAQEIKDVASSALTVNYDLFLANFNSLNKRMGELRDNANSQGVWTRVFGGAMSNDFGAGSKTQYVTAQAGYDYSLTLGDARNYMGIAVAYGHSTTKSNTLNIQASQGATITLQDVKSNMVEVGLYNSYVADNGWYNDTIFKFDYIMSSFTMTDNLSLESETNNFAMILSDEFGYRYKFAENEKGNWYIDPQVEVAFGYFNQSDFNRAMVATNSTLEASQDNILTLRTRAGLSLGKKFNTSKGFASVYVGAFYEYDYINGGDAEVLSKSGIANPLDKLESNGRAIVNVGSNIELTEGVRMYIDVEKSFGDKQRTDMQFNFGARYSFGEKVPTISYQEQQKKKVAPLKVEDEQEVQESKTEASANTEAKQ